MKKIIKFIKDNNISLVGGSQGNSDLVTLIGYTQHLDLTDSDLKTAVQKQIDKDSSIEDEIDRLWMYCKSKNYAAWWNRPEAKNIYKF